jgi:AcrR family transcriptional regulator
MSSKSDETRTRILAAAMEQFRERGFQAATMREIAERAGVATGAAYYYFDSKDAIVLAFYDQATEELGPALEKALAGGKDLRTRLLALLDAKLAFFAPNRRLLGALSAYADPENPLSPFSERTREIREKDIGFFERAIEGTRVKIPSSLKPHLPRVLWLYQMGIILFWIYDRSPHQARSRALLEKSLDIVVRLIRISSFPLMQPLRRMVIDLIETVADN